MAHPTRLLSTGVAGLDTVLCGGWPANRMYLLQGDPGAGKTTMALHFLLEAVAASHGWSLDNIDIYELMDKPKTARVLWRPDSTSISRNP